jgi:hypothetical protein
VAGHGSMDPHQRAGICYRSGPVCGRSDGRRLRRAAPRQLFYARDPGHPDFTHATIELSGGGDTIWRGTFNAGIRAQITLSGNGYFVSQVFDSAGSILWPMRGWRTLAHAKKHAKLVAQRTEEIQRAAVAQRLREDMSQTIVNATEEMISYDASS